ncbi:MAG TPA: hypothetical protein VFA20_13610 [Myxococcaceae bacterium]|nr:hypothetical protein [Myxococcaceae bacterium]
MERAQLIHALEERFRRIMHLLYDTSVSPPDLDREISPYLADDVRFRDPWQGETGSEKYRLGAAGFHAMFRFHFELYQLNVHLEADGRTGRALADGVMHLKPVRFLPSYPLRTILAYEFEVTAPPDFLIYDHEEMWSLADMIEALPGIGWFYAKVFRPAFSKGFLAASRLSLRAKDELVRIG